MATQPAESADRTQTFIDWVQINSRYLTAGAVVIGLAALGYWFYMKNLEIKSAKADQMLMQAKQSINSGNAALATSDLQKLVSTYGNTGSAAEGAELLAQMNYDQGKYQDGINILQKSVDSHGSDVRAELLSLIGDGYAQMKKLPDAASYYEKAADATGFPAVKATELAKAGRAYQAAGKKDEAVRIWTKLAADEKIQSIATEAKVRLGELTAKPAS